ncbi:hypothetical protein SGPA1_40289 [Streptomyces misionensis JCM 4497]
MADAAAVGRPGGPRRDHRQLRGEVGTARPGRPPVPEGLPAQTRLRAVQAGADVLQSRTRPPPARRRQYGGRRAGPSRWRAGLPHPVPAARPCADRRRTAGRGTRGPPRPGQGRRRVARGPGGARPGRARGPDVGAPRLRPARRTPVRTGVAPPHRHPGGDAVVGRELRPDRRRPRLDPRIARGARPG